LLCSDVAFVNILWQSQSNPRLYIYKAGPSEKDEQQQ
jgi:hypothetical protein